ncbi:MAG: hypothetical protein KGH64_02940 [Candidatus Micrarchaeota archaeon]|nr:hypothetical protein [Candidatus Micrarchaeota archaeon]
MEIKGSGHCGKIVGTTTHLLEFPDGTYEPSLGLVVRLDKPFLVTNNDHCSFLNLLFILTKW